MRLNAAGSGADRGQRHPGDAGPGDVARPDLATTEALLAQIDDRLTEGYAWALSGDAWSMRTEQLLHELDGDTLAVDDRGLRLLAREHVRFRRDLIALRRELAALRRERDRLRAYWRTLSG
jgi:ABC-type phosphate transport system auxiliary subunit